MSRNDILRHELQTLAIRRSLRHVGGQIDGLLTVRLLASPLICVVAAVLLADLAG